MRDYINKNKNIIIVFILLITCISLIAITYAAGNNNNTIFTRDELSEMINNQKSISLGLDEAVTSLNSNIKFYVNNEKVTSLDTSKQYVMDRYSCQSPNEIIEYYSYNNLLVMSNITGTSNCSAYFVEGVLYTYNADIPFYVFRAPTTGSYIFELWGAQGGDMLGDMANDFEGGDGSYTKGVINLTQGATLGIFVGEKPLANSGGYNGGGHSTLSEFYNYGSMAGGGATDIRTYADLWDNPGSLASRIMVAAGGSGEIDGGLYYEYFGASGIPGGGLFSYAGTQQVLSNNQLNTMTDATYASQTFAGTKSISDITDFDNATSGGFGFGGSGANYNGTGAGSGYYGGGGGATNWGVIGIGSSGSSYISGHTGCVTITSTGDITPKAGCTSGTSDRSCSIHPTLLEFSDTLMIDGKGYKWTTTVDTNYTQMPKPFGGFYAEGEGHKGHGFAKITFVSN